MTTPPPTATATTPVAATTSPITATTPPAITTSPIVITPPVITTTPPITSTISPITTTGSSTSPITPIMTTTPPLVTSTSQPQPDATVPPMTSAPPEVTVVSSGTTTSTVAPPPIAPATSVLMRSVDQFRTEYNRPRFTGAELISSHPSTASTEGLLEMALSRMNNFAAAITQDLHLLDRHHKVNVSALLQSGDSASGGCVQAHPLGVVPEIRADCSQSVQIFYML